MTSTDTTGSAWAAELAATLRGPLSRPGDIAYDEARTVDNAVIDRKPAAIARVADVADVIACVRSAREHGLLLSLRGGGHNAAGLGVADGALVVDLSTCLAMEPHRGRPRRSGTGCRSSGRTSAPGGSADRSS